ncbi:MAG: ATP-dependent helicase [Nitrososphaerota archaeon]|nr:ATP-dependent helicase [Nitrososphaerota archaeon]MDG7013193.1 ATP-dependent helicase [Nitrososphaerota archaeon]MDG7026274.1 ATP-dependent helicase [Nitrososphaerota archaeon]
MAEAPPVGPEPDSRIQTEDDPSRLEVSAAVAAPRAFALNEEKVRALEAEGNVLVIANPGTGKTLLLAHKYAQLVRVGVKPEEILCLTYTDKATDEMREAIIKVLVGADLEIELSRIKVTTFHAYALEAIGAQQTMSNNLLRYAVFRYLVDNKVFNYGEEYLLGYVVPKVEDSVRYLKSFGVMPDDVNLPRVQALLGDYGSVTKQEMDRYAEAFLEIFRRYESVKAGKGIDYADMLLQFMKLRKKPHFRHALVDELQDASAIEADMVLQSCDEFFVVGDKKQAIFAFQGGSIVNFRKFEDSKKPVLSENFRSTNEILEYARAFFVGRTKDPTAADEMRDLRNREKGPGPRPKVYNVPGDATVKTACELVQNLRNEGKHVAVIGRTNSQIREISQELGRRRIEHSSTYFQASDEAHAHVVGFLRGILSDDIRDVRAAMFTPFFPVRLRDAFSLAQLEDDELRKELPVRCPEFKRMRDRVKKLPDVDELFRDQIVPVAVSYGREYLLAALDLQKAFSESMGALGGADLDSVIAYLKSSEPAADESAREKGVVLTTVHKAKGRQFEAVVYVPQSIRGREDFQDEVVKRILETRGVNVEEELSEEPLRIDFVALTRAKDELHIVTEEAQDYLNEFAERGEVELGGVDYTDTSERAKRAFNLFVNGETEEAKQALEPPKKAWLREFVADWFAKLDHVSFTSLPSSAGEGAAEEYLVSKVLGVEEPSASLETGSLVHEAASAILSGNEYTIPGELEPFVDNVKTLVGQIKRDYPEVVAAEHEIQVPLEKLIGEGKGTNFEGRIDAIFRNQDGGHLLVDWKTSRTDRQSSSYRQQLQAYRHAYSISASVPIESIRTAIGFVGLRGAVNLRRTRAVLDSRQPREEVFETFRAKVRKVLLWKAAPDSFLEELGVTSDDLICRAVQEEFELES